MKVPVKKVKKIKKLQKRFNDKLVGKEVVIIKTIITYIDSEEAIDNNIFRTNMFLFKEYFY